MLSLIFLCLCISSSVFSKEINNHNSLNLTTTTATSPSSGGIKPITTTTSSPEAEGHHHHPAAIHDAKTDSDEERQLCPTCGGNDCNTNMTISGLPIIQVIIALAVGIFWAKVFLWLFKNFYEKGNSEHEPQPQYGVPMMYGVPQSTYGANIPQSTYGSPSSRSLNTDFLSLTQNVWKAVKDFSELWGEKDN